MAVHRQIRSGISHYLVIAIIVVVAGAAFAVVSLWPEQGADRPAFVPADTASALRDEFAEQSTLDWNVIRESKEGVSLTLHPGELSIRTDAGTIWEQQPDVEFAKNLHVIQNPAAADDAWQITTMLVQFEPQGQYHQAGLLIYADDDNYIKLVIQYNSRTQQKLGFSTERNGDANAQRVDFDLQQPNDWLRIAYRDGVYTASISYDGESFTKVGQVTWDGAPTQVGLIAKQGPNTLLPPIYARFGFFEFKKLSIDDSIDLSGEDSEGSG